MNKYGNVKTMVDLTVFDSHAEATRYQELKILARAGEIENLETQPRFVILEAFKDFENKLHRSIEYVADFKYFDKRLGKEVVEDVKGFSSQLYLLKKKMFLKKYKQYIFREINV